MLVPRQRDDDAVDRLIAEGKLPPKSGDHAVRLPRRVQPSPAGPTASEILEELRGTS